MQVCQTEKTPQSPRPESSSAYPPVDVAVALAERSHALPGSSPVARARLAFVVALGAAENWSEESQAALALREIDWRAVERHIEGESLDALQRLDPTVLLAWLDRHRGRSGPRTILNAVSAHRAGHLPTRFGTPAAVTLLSPHAATKFVAVICQETP